MGHVGAQRHVEGLGHVEVQMREALVKQVCVPNAIP